MTEEAKLAADTLRKMANFKQFLAFPQDTGRIINACADMIESLTAQLEQVTRERDGLNIMLSQALAMLEARTRERDAAVKYIDKNCETCAHLGDGEYVSNDCMDCIRNCNWQWRGVR